MMKNLKLISVALLVLLFAASCNNQKQELKQEIEATEDRLFSNQAGNLHQDSARLLVEQYMQYAENFPEDTLAQNYMFKAARVDVALGDYESGLKKLKSMEEKYPESHHIPKVLLLKGTIYEDYMQDYDKAGQAYQQLIDDYPDDEFAKDAAVLKKNLGKSLDEIIREFEEMETARQDSDSLSA